MPSPDQGERSDLLQAVHPRLADLPPNDLRSEAEASGYLLSLDERLFEPNGIGIAELFGPYGLHRSVGLKGRAKRPRPQAPGRLKFGSQRACATPSHVGHSFFPAGKKRLLSRASVGSALA